MNKKNAALPVYERSSEFLACLGNGKGRVTEEDEDPEEYWLEELEEEQ